MQALVVLFTWSYGDRSSTLALGSFAGLYVDQYGQSESQSNLHYIPIALGGVLAGQLGGPFMDWLWGAMKHRYPDKDPAPEYRIPHMVMPAIFVSLAMFWYGCSAQYGPPWPVVGVGVFVFTLGNFMFVTGPYAYIIDEFGDQAASALAATRMFRYVLGFAFPLFAPNLYEALGYGWGNSLLAIIIWMFGLPVIPISWHYGPKLWAIGRDWRGQI